MCGGFLGFEEFSSLVDAAKKDHSTDMTNQMLTSTDDGRVKKVMKAGWVEYTTRYTLWAGTQLARFEMESGMDRRFFVIDIDMTPEKELQYKMAQAKQASMAPHKRAELVAMADAMRDFFTERAMDVILNPPKGLYFDDEFNEWLFRPEARSHEADLFRRLALGYAVMSPHYKGGDILRIKMTDQLREILDRCLQMRRNVMDADMLLIKNTFGTRRCLAPRSSKRWLVWSPVATTKPPSGGLWTRWCISRGSVRRRPSPLVVAVVAYKCSSATALPMRSHWSKRRR